MSNPKKITMDMQTVLILLLTGVAAGMLGGMVGIGGGIIIVPALIYFLGFSQFKAQGTSLALLLFPVGILGVWQYYKQGQVDFSVVAIIAAGFILGSLLGSRISLSMPQETVKKVFACILILIALKMLFLDKPAGQRNPSTQANNQNLTKT